MGNGGELHEGRGLEGRILEHLERGLDHGVLPFGIAGTVERMAVAKRNEQGSRRSHLLGHLAKQLDRDAGDALPLELGADQADRLVAQRSDRNQQGGVDRVADQLTRGLRGRVLDQPSGCGDAPHEAQVTPAHRPDATPLGELSHAVDRKHQVGIVSHIRVVEGLAAMHVDQARDIGVGRDLAEAGVPSAHFCVEGLLTGQHEAGARNDRDTAFTKRPAQRCTGYGVDATPAIRPEEQPVLESELPDIAQAAPPASGSRPASDRRSILSQASAARAAAKSGNVHTASLVYCDGRALLNRSS